jgi:hypothetical protein
MPPAASHGHARGIGSVAKRPKLEWKLLCRLTEQHLVDHPVPIEEDVELVRGNIDPREHQERRVLQSIVVVVKHFAAADLDDIVGRAKEAHDVGLGRSAFDNRSMA